MQRSFGLLSSLLVALVVAIPGVSDGGGVEQGGCAAGTHELTFVNSCSYTVWLAELGNTSAGTCTKSTDCIEGLQTCNVPVCSGASDCPAIECTSDIGLSGTWPDLPRSLGTPLRHASVHPLARPAATAPVRPRPVARAGACVVATACAVAVSASSTRSRRRAGSSSPTLPTTICIPKGWQGRFWGRTECTSSPVDSSAARGSAALPTRRPESSSARSRGTHPQRSSNRRSTPGIPSSTSTM